MITKYRSKIDLWLGALLILAVLVLLISVLQIAVSGASWWAILLQGTLLLGLGIFTLSLLTNTYYTISDESIFVRSGPFRWNIPMEEVNLIEPSRKAWSSAALSLDRLYIEYGGGNDSGNSGIYISPVDKARFMRDAAERDPNLEYDGDRVKRVDDLVS